MEPLAVDIKQAAEMTSLSPHTIRAYIRNGILPVSHAGRRVLVSVASLRKLVCNGVERLNSKGDVRQ